jgi:RNA polymerase sigma factor (TIGR02999 family)
MSSQPQKAISSDNGEISSVPGDTRTLDELFTRLYERIRRLAARVRWNGTNPTLNPTALAHEAYMKLRKDPPELATKSYDEVAAIFANVMRQILTDAARRKGARKRAVADLGGGTNLPIEDVITIDAALEQLERENPLQARVVQCRFLLGMTVDETAATLQISKRTIEREWHDARARLTSIVDPAKD